HERAAEPRMSLERPRQLEEVDVVQRAPDRLVQLVLRDGVETARGDERDVVAVDHLAEEKRVGKAGPYRRGERRPERARRGVHGVEPPAVAASREPVGRDRDRPAEDDLAPVVERDQLRMALEGAVFEAVGAAAGEVETEPVALARSLALAQHVR